MDKILRLFVVNILSELNKLDPIREKTLMTIKAAAYYAKKFKKVQLDENKEHLAIEQNLSYENCKLELEGLDKVIQQLFDDNFISITDRGVINLNNLEAGEQEAKQLPGSYLLTTQFAATMICVYSDEKSFNTILNSGDRRDDGSFKFQVDEKDLEVYKFQTNKHENIHF